MSIDRNHGITFRPSPELRDRLHEYAAHRRWPLTVAITALVEDGLDTFGKAVQLPDLERTVAELRVERDRLHSWDGLMSLLDEHYPADLFVGGSGDPGSRIIVLIREVDSLREKIHDLLSQIELLEDEIHNPEDEIHNPVEVQ